MNIARIRMTFAVALVLVLIATGLWAGGADEGSTAAAADKKYVTDPTTGKVVVAPEYGGTITFGRPTSADHPDFFYITGHAYQYIGLVNEKIAIGDWGMDRSDFDFSGPYVPLFAFTGNLAESWDTPDPRTVILNIRQGVYWHNKAPMNGRELTAKDVEYNFHRLLGNKLTGTEFSEAEPSPMASALISLSFESITATDKWTVVCKVKEPVAGLLYNIIDSWETVIYPPEVIEEHGDYKDWRNTVGTGPFELTEVVEGSSYTFTKNPNYWRYDEKYPQNRLPYVDKITSLVMPEVATQLAALRAGRIDMLGTFGDSQIRLIDQVERLRDTDPEIEVWPHRQRSDNSFRFIGYDRPPFDDIRVRQAMQMALDTETMANTYFSGYGEPTPNGFWANDVPGIGTPFEEWPEEVKKTYNYDPAGAEALLDAAGYKRGADGIRFKTGMAIREYLDASYYELAAAYWRDIGVEIEIDVMDIAGFQMVTRDQDTYRIGGLALAFRQTNYVSTLRWIWYTDMPGNNAYSDPQMDAMIEAAEAAGTIEEQLRILKETNTWIIENALTVWGPETPAFQANQAWVIGYNGEASIGFKGQQQSVLTRLWIDSELKKAMGR